VLRARNSPSALGLVDPRIPLSVLAAFDGDLRSALRSAARMPGRSWEWYPICVSGGGLRGPWTTPSGTYAG